MEHIQKAIRYVDPQAEVTNIASLSGGSISSAYRVDTNRRSYFLKWHEEAPYDFFRQEKRGLEFLRESGAVHVPDVLHWSKKFIIMDIIQGKGDSRTDEWLGIDLANLHQSSGDYFGLEEDNFIGELPQENSWETSWVRFVRDHRLRPQMEIARSLGKLTDERSRRLRYILDHLEEWIPDDRQPVKLHGDLWAGNWLTGEEGRPYLIDPACWYGDYEFDLAFTRLFGGFSERTYEAYETIQPVEAEFEERMPLYQLYYLLVHLNVFGEMYGAQVDRVLALYSRSS